MTTNNTKPNTNLSKQLNRYKQLGPTVPGLFSLNKRDEI